MERIFKRAGAKRVVAVKSDSGMMGGSISHEFMLLSDIGEDTLAICPECGYKANMEAADVIIQNEPGTIAPLEKVYTPGVKTIEDLGKSSMRTTRLSARRSSIKRTSPTNT